jgi:predicted ATPase
LQHFKCFELLRLPIGPLTILSGMNASGKSSVLQSLVLLHQTIREQEWSTRLMLNGDELRLGTVTDVVDKVTGRRSFGIGLTDDDEEVVWTFEGNDRKDMSAVVTSVRVGPNVYEQPEVLRFLLPAESSVRHEQFARRLRRLTCLTAERVGPREVYPLDDPSSTEFVGPCGEGAVSILHWGRNEQVLPDLIIPTRPPTLLHQVEARMGELFPGCLLDVQQVSQANSVTLGIRTSETTDFHRPVHVGFGLTQVLPIVVAALSREVGDILLIENPEVHLHPAGQATIGVFLAQVAAAGIQVLIETHSDHVLNGIRRAVRNKLLKPEDTLIHFFRRDQIGGTQVVSPTIDGTGNIDKWPEGFFDQFDKDMNYFAGWGR